GMCKHGTTNFPDPTAKASSRAPLGSSGSRRSCGPPRRRRSPMRFVGMLVLAVALGLLLVPSASAIRFTDDSYLVPEGVVGQDYFHWFKGDGGCGPALPYQFRVLSGALPPGLSLLDDGELVGIPTQSGSWSFWLELSDEDPPSEPWCIPRKSERAFTVNI